MENAVNTFWNPLQDWIILLRKHSLTFRVLHLIFFLYTSYLCISFLYELWLLEKAPLVQGSVSHEIWFSECTVLCCTKTGAPVTCAVRPKFRVSGWEKDGDWGSKSTCFGVWCSLRKLDIAVCYTIGAAGEYGSALAKRNCSVSLSVSVQLSLFLLFTKGVRKASLSALGTVCEFKCLRGVQHIMKPEPVFSVGDNKWLRDCPPMCMMNL